MEYAFRDDDGTVTDTEDAALEHGGKGQADDLVKGDFGFVEHLRDNGHRAVSRFTDTQGKMASGTSHGADDEPIAGSTGIFVHCAGKVRALVLGGIKTESRGVVRQRKVVVDSLGNVDVVDRILLGLQELGDAVCRGCGIVTAYGHQELDVVVLKQAQVEIFFEILVSGLETAHLQIAAAPVEISIRLEEVNVFRAGSLGEKTAVTAVQSDDAVTVGEESLGDGHHDRVHARSRATSAEDNDGIFHFV